MGFGYFWTNMPFKNEIVACITYVKRMYFIVNI